MTHLERSVTAPRDSSGQVIGLRTTRDAQDERTARRRAFGMTFIHISHLKSLYRAEKVRYNSAWMFLAKPSEKNKEVSP